MFQRLNYPEINKPAIDRLAAVNKHLTSIDSKLRAVVELRVSQLNGCAFCVDLHAREARSAGETTQRLDTLVAWTESPFFSVAERAALAWADSLTHVAQTPIPDQLYDDLELHYSEQQIVDLTLIINLMNCWNRMAIALKRLPDPCVED